MTKEEILCEKWQCSIDELQLNITLNNSVMMIIEAMQEHEDRVRAEYATQEKQGWVKIECVPYQLCPKCNGQGNVSKPSYVPGDVHQWSSTTVTHLCDICNGSKIIPMFVLPQNPEV